MARRKLVGVPWGNSAPAVEVFGSTYIPIIEIDDVTGIVYVGGNSAVSIGDSVQIINVSTAIAMGGTTNTYIGAVGGAGGIALTLPNAAGSDVLGSYAGRTVKIKKTDSAVGAVTINGSIDNLNTYALTTFNQYVNLESDGTVWQIVGNN